jgi:phage terminase large subunit
MEVVIPYQPRTWAETLHAAITRWFVLVLHRRAGKTTAVLNHLQRDCIRIPESQFAYIGPTYKQSKRVAWDIAKKMSRDIPGILYNESELTIRYPNGSKLILVGSDNPDSLRGLALWGVGFDEYSQQPSNIFSEIISKCLADHLGYAIFFGTPKGKNEFHRIYQAGLKDPAWTVVFRTIDDSLKDETGETIQNLRQALEDDRRLVAQGLMTEDEFNQEWYCSFEAAIKGAYYASQLLAARAAKRIKAVSYDPALKVHTVWDLGIGQHLGIGFYQRIGQEIHMIDYWEGQNKEGIPSAIKALQNKPYVYGKHFLPHDAQGTEQATEQTRLATAQKLWPSATWELIPKLSADDRINKGKLMFARLWIDETNCQTFLDYIAQYRQEWDEKRGMFLEKPYHDFTSHAADVHGYAALVEDRMTNHEPTKYKQPREESVSIYHEAA